MKLRHVLPLLGVMCMSAFSSAQLDPRERYGTYLGGSKADCVNDRALECGTAAHNYFPATNYASAVAVDSSSNVYVAGYTDAVDFPTTSGAYRRTANYQSDGFNSNLSKDSFAMKFNASGQLVWSTYLGIPLLPCLPDSPLDCALKTITVDASGNVVLVGRFRKGSSRYYSGSNAAFILKLNSTGSALAYYNEVFDLGEWRSYVGDGGGTRQQSIHPVAYTLSARTQPGIVFQQPLRVEPDGHRIPDQSRYNTGNKSWDRLCRANC